MGALMTIVWANLHNVLFAALLAGVAGVLLMKRFFWQRKTITLLGSSNLRNASLLRSIVSGFLLASSLIFLLIALARPQWEDVHQVVSQEGRDVLIALDISRSMLAQDLKPSRLEFAKNKVKQLVESLKADRVALMIFSGSPFIQCPFTTDTNAFLSFLDAVDVESISSGTTAIDKAIIKALETFKNMPSRKHPLMVIVTDGEDFSGHLEGVNKQAKELGLTIFTLGVGTSEGAPIPLYNDEGVQEGHQKDGKGAIVITRLDEAVLRSLSYETGAEFIKATEDESDIRALVSAVQRFEKEKFADARVVTKQEKYWYFAAASLLSLLLEWLVAAI